jgi:hypothetical protein
VIWQQEMCWVCRFGKKIFFLLHSVVSFGKNCFLKIAYLFFGLKRTIYLKLHNVVWFEKNYYLKLHGVVWVGNILFLDLCIVKESENWFAGTIKIFHSPQSGLNQ